MSAPSPTNPCLHFWDTVSLLPASFRLDNETVDRLVRTHFALIVGKKPIYSEILLESNVLHRVGPSAVCVDTLARFYAALLIVSPCNGPLVEMRGLELWQATREYLHWAANNIPTFKVIQDTVDMIEVETTNGVVHSLCKYCDTPTAAMVSICVNNTRILDTDTRTDNRVTTLLLDSAWLDAYEQFDAELDKYRKLQHYTIIENRDSQQSEHDEVKTTGYLSWGRWLMQWLRW